MFLPLSVFGLLLLLGAIWAIGCSFYLLSSVHLLNRRVAGLEARVIALGRQARPKPEAEQAMPENASAEAPRPRPTASKPEHTAAAPAPAPTTGEPVRVPAPVPERFVFTDENQNRLVQWLLKNWFSVVAALSLTFAGIFFVRYGIEHGLLPPLARVLCAMGLGAALILAGERIRRVAGAGSGALGHLLPSTLCSGGIVSLFSAILGARLLYDLVGVQTAFLGLVAVAVLAMALGLLHGAFLTIMGIAGAILSPFVIGGESAETLWLFYYFALIGCVALGTDAYQRTAWVSVAGLVMAYAGAILVHLSTEGSGPHFTAFAALTAAGAMTIPTLSVRPVFHGGMVFHARHGKGADEPSGFPTRLAAGGICGLTAVAVLVSGESAVSFWSSLIALGSLLGLLTIWLRTNVLDDAVPLVLVALLAVVGWQGAFDLHVASAFRTGQNAAAIQTITWITVFGMAVSLLAAWKSGRTKQFSIEWAAASAAFAPVTMILLTQLWGPLDRLADWIWALYIAAVAVLMAIFAHRVKNDISRLRPSFFTLSALTMLTLSGAIVLTGNALTLALAGMVVTAVLLDRRHDLPPLAIFVQFGVVVCGARLLLTPGLTWALDAPLDQVIVVFGGVIALLFAALRLGALRQREAALMTLESAVWSLPGVLACILTYRLLAEHGGKTGHWALSLYAMVWLISGAVQLYRSRIENALREIRIVLATLFCGTAAILLVAAVTVGNPLIKGVVVGPPLFNSVLVAYGIPAILVFGSSRLLRPFPEHLQIARVGLASLLAVVFVGLEIRHLWHGPNLATPGVVDGELYTYTVALLMTGAALLVRSLQRSSTLLRRIAMGVIGLAIVKVYVIDTGGLEGLIRVFSFLALGLVLAGLAWLDGIMAQRRAG